MIWDKFKEMTLEELGKLGEMTWEDFNEMCREGAREDAKEEGRAEGEKEAAETIAKRLGISVEQLYSLKNEDLILPE